jgi:hypothetical protein
MSMRNVLGVLEDEEDRLWGTFAAAVELATRERARLTLVKTYEPPQHYMWCAPFAVGGLFVAPDTDPQVEAGRLLARAAEFVPMDIPVTTMVLGIDAHRELRRLVACGAYDALVADADFMRHSRRLSRECRRDGVETVLVPATPHTGPELAPAARLAPVARG